MAELDDDMLEEVDAEENASEESSSEGKLAAIKKLLSNKIILISIISLLVISLTAGAYFLFIYGNDDNADSIELSEEMSSEQEMETTEETANKSSAFLSAISDSSNATDPKQTDDNIATDQKPSRLAQISGGMVEAAKTGGIPSSTGESTDGAEQTSSEQAPSEQAAVETPESKLLSELLTEKVAELELENQKLKEQIENLEIQIKLYKNTKRVEDLSIPVDRLGAGTTPSTANVTSSGLYDDGLVDTFRNDYSASPYADDEMTPKPTWGDAKSEANK